MDCGNENFRKKILKGRKKFRKKIFLGLEDSDCKDFLPSPLPQWGITKNSLLRHQFFLDVQKHTMTKERLK